VFLLGERARGCSSLRSPSPRSALLFDHSANTPNAQRADVIDQIEQKKPGRKSRAQILIAG
jgi:hypothetical protein